LAVLFDRLPQCPLSPAGTDVAMARSAMFTGRSARHALAPSLAFLLAAMVGCGADDPGTAVTEDAPAEEVGVSAQDLKLSGTDPISSGQDFSCALLEGGLVKCWGSNGNGQLGLGDRLSRGSVASEMGNGLTAVNLGLGRTAKMVRAGFGHACALLDNNQVKCWGSNGNGQLGLGDRLPRGVDAGQMGDNLPYVNLGAGRTAKAIAVGSAQTCVILDTDKVKCWGFNGGALGLGDVFERGSSPADMGDNLPTVALGQDLTAKAIGVGDSFACALLSNDQVKCWGINANGRVGIGSPIVVGDGPNEMGDNLPVVALGTNLKAKSLAVGATSACVVLQGSNQVKCWGKNTSGMLGLGHTNDIGNGPDQMGDHLPTVLLGAGHSALSVSVGLSATCVRLETKDVKCWGEAGNGQLGQGDTLDRGDGPSELGDQLLPIQLGTTPSNTPHKAESISVGHGSVCATLSTRQAKCWGSNVDGQLGLGSSVTSPRGDGPNEMGNNLNPLNLGSRASQAVTVGDGYSCALLSNGGLKCWGLNVDGQLGIGSANNRGDQAGELGENLPFVNLGSGLTVKAVSALSNHTCAILSNDGVKCWGSNQAGQLGLGNTASRGTSANEMGDLLPFVDLGAGRTARGIGVGRFFSCALLDNAQVKCWGKNDQGQLGLGDTQNRGDSPGEMATLPAVNGGGPATLLAVGPNHACAILEDNRLKCWGSNGAGQLGLGDIAARGDQLNEMGTALPAVNLGTGRTAKAVSLGGSHSCAWLDNNQIKCWGSNASGVLGLSVGHGLPANSALGDASGEMGDALPTVSLGAGRTARSVVATSFSTCAVLDTQQLKCWGQNVDAALGLGDAANRGDAPNEMGDFLPTLFFGPGRQVKSLAGTTHACALLNSNEVKCWGKNSSGQLGVGSTANRGGSRSDAVSGYTAVDLGVEN
jgi:alpha-tubulin suppressor-like RCC1 family protein